MTPAAGTPTRTPHRPETSSVLSRAPLGGTRATVRGSALWKSKRLRARVRFVDTGGAADKPPTGGGAAQLSDRLLATRSASPQAGLATVLHVEDAARRREPRAEARHRSRPPLQEPKCDALQRDQRRAKEKGHVCRQREPKLLDVCGTGCGSVLEEPVLQGGDQVDAQDQGGAHEG
eukprot:scaffold62248_cov63-Phaeocystis_antarctica.AAC.6